MVLLLVGLALMVLGLVFGVVFDARMRNDPTNLWPGGIVLVTLFLGVAACYLSAT